MESDCKYLFVYGSLLDSDNQFGAYLKNNSSFFTKGSFSGLLYDLGEYPGAVYKAEITDRVYGDIVLLNDNPSVLQTIDEYEGYGEEEEQPNLFVRFLVPVDTTSGIVDCWVYLYNLPVDGFKQIRSGKYKQNL
jgi:gamma-glutamylcyclotransferase (GGCT)/AIG2-like uncharacterized protein YtfP